MGHLFRIKLMIIFINNSYGSFDGPRFQCLETSDHVASTATALVRRRETE